MSGGTADFFYREAQRLGYVARSAFKASEANYPSHPPPHPKHETCSSLLVANRQNHLPLLSQLLQIQKRFNVIRPGDSVLDLGCAPGAWLQVACQSLGSTKKGGLVVGVDVKKVRVPSTYCDARVSTICADVMSLPNYQARAFSAEGKGFSVILSDMCPSVSGITTKDTALSYELGMQALSLAVGKVTLPGLEYPPDENPLNHIDNDDEKHDGILQQGGNVVIKVLESGDTQDFSKICKSYFKKTSWLRPRATRSSSREIYLICQGLR